MQKYVKTVSLFLILFNIQAFASAESSSIKITDPQKTLMVGQEESLATINLSSNPTTGYVWLLTAYDPALLKIVKHRYIVPANIENKVGVSGIEQWQFTIKPNSVGPQLTKIHFIHARPWDVDHTMIEEKTFSVVVN